MEPISILPDPAVVSSKTVSVWLSANDLERFQRAADARGMKLSTFFKQSAAAALTPPDPRTDFKRLSADLRADLGQTINRIAETDALQARSREQAIADIRDLLGGFLHDLAEQQVAAVLGAVRAGQGNPATPKRDPTPAELGLPPRAPNLK